MRSGSPTRFGLSSICRAPRVLVIDGRAIFDIEYTALQMLAGIDERLAAEGTTLWLAGLNPETLAVVRRSPLGERLGQPRMFANLDAAVHEYDRQYAARPVPPASFQPEDRS